MAYPFDPDQQAVIDKFLSDTKVFYTKFMDGERANAETFNNRLNELAGVLAYLNENKQQPITVGNTEPTSPVQNQFWIDTTGNPALYKYWNGTEWLLIGGAGGGSGGEGNPVDFTSYQVSLTSSSTAQRIDDPSFLIDRIYSVENIGYYAVFLGADNSVTSSTGFKLEPGDVYQIHLTTAGSIWGVTEFGTVRLSVMRGH